MAEEPKTEKTITDKETTKKKVKIGAAKATEPAAAEVVSPPAAPAVKSDMLVTTALVQTQADREIG